VEAQYQHIAQGEMDGSGFENEHGAPFKRGALGRIVT